jgi:aspartyl-tRNA synthetase
VHGYQIKWALTFPRPQGTSEYLISHVIEEMQNAGVTTANFGAGAKDTVEVIDNIKGINAKLLSEIYKAIVNLFSLTNKSQYRYVALSVFRLSSLTMSCRSLARTKIHFMSAIRKGA